MIHVLTPYSLGKDLGAAYNQAMQLIPESDYACLIDYDVLFLLPDTIAHLHEYVRLFPDAALLTCYVNRASPLSKMQLLNGRINEDANIKNHIHLADKQKQFLYQTTEIKTDISGFLMLISKQTWNEHKFIENGNCLGIDTAYGRTLREAGKTILRMDGIVVFHIYRMAKGIYNKSHLHKQQSL